MPRARNNQQKCLTHADMGKALNSLAIHFVIADIPSIFRFAVCGISAETITDRHDKAIGAADKLSQ